MAELPHLHCTHCGHTWVPRKAEPPKKCPRCQRPPRYIEYVGGPAVDRTAEDRAMTDEERAVVAGVLEILRNGDRIEREALLRAVARRGATRGMAEERRARHG